MKSTLAIFGISICLAACASMNSINAENEAEMGGTEVAFQVLISRL